MSASGPTHYSEIPLEPQPIPAPYLYPTPPLNEKKQLPTEVEECAPLPPSNTLLTSAYPQSRSTQGRLFWLSSTAHKFWLLEAAASVCSLLIFAAILGILGWYNDTIYGDASSAQQNATKRPRIFPVLAFLSGVMRAVMLLPVATAIGQLKWSWFRTGRRLIDMERFDEAARGILGSAKLFWTLRFRNLAAIGAALTILALPLDALIQSAVLIPLKLEVNDVLDPVTNITNQTYMGRSTSYTDYQIMENVEKPWPVTSLINTIMFGVSYGQGLDNIVDAMTKVECPTGYCKFPKAQTLAVNSKCVNRTGEIQTWEEEGFLPYQTLPGTELVFYPEGNGTMQRQIISAESNATWPDDEYETNVFGSIGGPLIVRTAILLRYEEDSPTLGIECRLYWHINTSEDYVDDTSNFKFNSTQDIVQYRFGHGKDDLWVITPTKCFVEGEEIPANKSAFYTDNCVFVVGNKTGKALENMLKDPQDGLRGDSWLKNGTSNEWTRTNMFVTNLYEASAKDTSEAALHAIDTMWSNIAFAATFTIRRAASYMSDGSKQYLNTTGTVYRPIYYYHVDWARLSMPALILVCSAAFVLYTALLTRKEYAWRRSALPLLFHGLEDSERVALGDVRDFNVMLNVAENLHVKLEEHVDANGARFTTQH